MKPQLVRALAGLALLWGSASLAAQSPELNARIASEQSSQRAQVASVQVLLDRARFSPGVIDGIMGANTHRAIRAFQQSNALPPTGQIDRVLLKRLQAGQPQPLFQMYTITSKDADGPYRSVPSTMTGKAELDRVAFETPAEALAEKFHMAKSFLVALNPDADFGRVGTTIRVVRPGNDENLQEVARIEVDKNRNELRAYSPDGSLVATYPTTVGSSVHPSPDDRLKVLAIAPHPTYHFDPSGRSWGPDKALTIAPGPNNPVGVVWIDLSRDGYGIHGTPEPRLIGKTSSHGCVRLTNWDAHELSLAVSKGTEVIFQ